MSTYGLSREYPFSFETVLKLLPKELRKKGFDILSSCDINDTFREFLGISFKRYTIFSVANLPLSYKALQREELFGLVLPCNVAVFEKEGSTVVAALNLRSFMHIINNENLNEGAAIIERKLHEVLESLEKKKERIQKGRAALPRKFEKAVA